jgi:glycerate kinase
MYRMQHGVDVASLPGAGAAGGLAGGLVALGATLVNGCELIADEIGLFDAIPEADLVITGEGHLDEQSFAGKVVGGVAEIAHERGVPVAVICGDMDDDLDPHLAAGLTVVSLTREFGAERALGQPLACVEEVTARIVAEHRGRHA